MSDEYHDDVMQYTPICWAGIIYLCAFILSGFSFIQHFVHREAIQFYEGYYDFNSLSAAARIQ